MKLILNEEQNYLKETALSFVSEKTPVSHLRGLRDSDDQLCWDKEIWSEMVKLGWSGILIPEEYGGSNFGLTGMSVILQECGKTLTPSPLFASGVIGATALTKFGSEEQKQNYLSKIASGELTTALAIDENSHHSPNICELKATKDGSSYILSGKKIFVVDGASADIIIAVARTSGEDDGVGGLSMFLVESDNSNINKVKLNMADSRNYANITFDNVSVDENMILGEVDMGLEPINEILDVGRIALSAEMLGSCEKAFEITIEYLKERKQFGVPIGSFQALQHRAAEMFCEIELTKSAVMAAMQGAEENSNDLQRLSSLAKSIVGETSHLVSNEAIQMHGGIGVTDEYDIGFYLKRARVAETILGNSTFHQERYANLTGF